VDTLQSLLQLDGSSGISSGEVAAQPDNAEAANSTSVAGISQSCYFSSIGT